MAIDNNFIRDFLFNYWDTHGNLDGLSKNAKRIYQLIIDRRKKSQDKRPVNDYIYASLGVTPKGRLGEEITFELNNHVRAYNSLKNVKDCKVYNKLVKLSVSLDTPIEELLEETDLAPYLNTDPVVRNFNGLNKILTSYSYVIDKLILADTNPMLHALVSYYRERGSLYNFNQELPEVYAYLCDKVKFEMPRELPEGITNADSIMIGQRLAQSAEDDSQAMGLDQLNFILELAYQKLGFGPNRVLPPSTRFMVYNHLDVYKTLYGMVRTNPQLYNILRNIYLIEGTYNSLADMMRSEGFYFPELSTESVQYIPCQNKDNIIGVCDFNPTHFILDKTTMAYVLENEMSENLQIKTSDNIRYLTIAVKDEKTKKVDYLPFHSTFTGRTDTVCLDGNLLNLSASNLLAN